MIEKVAPTLVILGGTSAVAMAYARDAANAGERIVLVGRNKAQLESNVVDLNSRGSCHASCLIADLSDPSTIIASWQTISSSVENIDRVLLAYGVLGGQHESQNNIEKLVQELNTNFVSATLWCELAYQYFRQAGLGQLSVIGSVAGDRGRQSNYHYGAAKGGLAIFLEGMQHRAAQQKEATIGVLLIKPGFIDTPMTDHIDKGGPLWAKPEQIAKIIRRAETKRQRIVYAPWYWRVILMIVRYVPFFIFKRSSL